MQNIVVDFKGIDQKTLPKFEIEEQCKKLPTLSVIVKSDTRAVVEWSGDYCLILEFFDKDSNLEVRKLIYPGVTNVISEKDIFNANSSDESK